MTYQQKMLQESQEFLQTLQLQTNRERELVMQTITFMCDLTNKYIDEAIGAQLDDKIGVINSKQCTVECPHCKTPLKMRLTRESELI